MSSTDTTAANVELVTELSRRFREGDQKGAAALFHPSIRIRQPESLPHGGRHEGLEGMAAMGAAFARHWERTIGDWQVRGCDDGTVLQVTSQTWTSKATGRCATVDVVELLTVTDGRITEITVYQGDTHLLMSTLDQPLPS